MKILSLSGTAACTGGLEKDPDDTLIDNVWGGADLAFNF